MPGGLQSSVSPRSRGGDLPWVEGSSQSCRPPRQLPLTPHVLCELCKVERRLKSLSVAGDTIAQMEGERSAGRGGGPKGGSTGAFPRQAASPCERPPELRPLVSVLMAAVPFHPKG